MDRWEITRWLRESDPARLNELWQTADATRRTAVGNAVHLRGLVEVSNHCVRRCGYCGLRLDRTDLARYRMSAEEVLACAHQAVAFGYGTVVLQSGEDPGIDVHWMGDLIRRIKAETHLAVTLSLGERSDSECRLWREAGADRYLLRFETSDPVLYAAIHPSRGGHASDRIAMLRRLRVIGYEIGSGVMIGIPGQGYDSLARDIETFAELDLDMIGVGPYLPHPLAPIVPGHNGVPAIDPANQTPADEQMTYKVIALARLACPRANIPSTTALATINTAQGRELGLSRGANVVMPNLTPTRYRAMYEIYPGKACVADTGEACHTCLTGRINRLGRDLGIGRGDSPNYQARTHGRTGPEMRREQQSGEDWIVR